MCRIGLVFDEHNITEPNDLAVGKSIKSTQGSSVLIMGDAGHLMTPHTTQYSLSSHNFTMDFSLDDALNIYADIIHFDSNDYENITITNNCLAIGIIDIIKSLGDNDSDEDADMVSLMKTYNKSHKTQASIKNLPKSIQTKLSKKKA